MRCRNSIDMNMNMNINMNMNMDMDMDSKDLRTSLQATC